MSAASAGKVLMIPKGEYDATTQYKVLDWVLYQGRPYVAKQTTTGNTPIYEPTQANPDAYWQLLLDFPTVVDNVPTQNSNNLVKSGGVYSSVSGKMDVDGSNSSMIGMGISGFYAVEASTITKPSGVDQTVSIVIEVPETANGKQTDIVEEQLFANRNDTRTYYYDTGISSDRYIRIISIDDVHKNASGSDYIDISAKLVTDDSGAISQTSRSIYLHGEVKDDRCLSVGNACAAIGAGSLALGKRCVTRGNYSIASGDECAVGSTGRMAIGVKTYANANSMAEGEYTSATSNCSHAEGSHTNTYGPYQHVMGKYNDAKYQTLFEIGYGSASTPNNVFEVYNNGAISQDNGTSKFRFAVNNGAPGYYDGSNVFHAFEEPIKLVNNSVILSTSQDTDVTFSNAAITEDSSIEVFTNIYTIVPKDVVVASGGGSVTVTFAKVSSATTIKVKVEVKN